MYERLRDVLGPQQGSDGTEVEMEAETAGLFSEIMARQSDRRDDYGDDRRAHLVLNRESGPVVH